MTNRIILITGVAGFIGSSLAKSLLSATSIQTIVVGVDNMNDYYDVDLKNSRLVELCKFENFIFNKLDISNKDDVKKIFSKYKFSHVINLAAQAGVRYARENPDSYIESNINGFYNIIKESCSTGVERFLYASSSSVYGTNTKIPFQESDAAMTPMSLYAATKLSNESIASSFYYTYGLNTIGMRFFNVYGPWGRPDMAYFKWTKALLSGEKIELRNNGDMWRDMTYIDDVVFAIGGLINVDKEKLSEPVVLNIGNRSPIKISDVLDFIAKKLNKNPDIINGPKGDEEPLKTWADTNKLRDLVGFMPDTDYQYGLEKFLDWYEVYYS